MTLSAVLLQRCRGLSEGDAASAEAYASFFGLWCVCHILKRWRGHQLSAIVYASMLPPTGRENHRILSANHLQICGFYDGDGSCVGVGVTVVTIVTVFLLPTPVSF